MRAHMRPEIHAVQESLAIAASQLAESIARYRATGASVTGPSDALPPYRCYWALVRAATSSGAKLIVNDLIDLFHAAVPLSETNLVVLDSRWAEFCRQVKPPLRVAQVFPVKDAGIDAFLSALESWPSRPPEAK